jgi:hypothetical protein
MLNTSYILNLVHLFKIALEFKRYIWQKLKREKIQNLSRTTKDKQVSSLEPKVGTTHVAIDNHMVIIQVQIGKNTIKDLFLDGGSKINIITKLLRLRLGLLKPKLAPYSLRMVDKTTTKPMGLIKDLKIYVHDIPYITTFIILQNNVVDSSYSILLGRPWLGDAKVAHDWESNNVTIQGNGIVIIIIISKHWEIK